MESQIVKANYNKYKDTCECINCKEIVQRGNEGFFCLKCKILFNICENCDDNIIVLIKGWGDIYYFEEDDNDGPEDKTYDDYYQNIISDNIQKYFLSSDDNYTPIDYTKYLWFCPCCKKYEQTSNG